MIGLVLVTLLLQEPSGSASLDSMRQRYEAAVEGERWQEAVRLLRDVEDLGSDAVSGIPWLLEECDRRGAYEVRRAAERVLERMGPEAILPMILDRVDRPWDGQLLSFEPDAPGSVDRLGELLLHPDHRVAAWAAFLLSGQEDAPERGVLKLIDSTVGSERRAGLRASAVFEGDDSLMLPALEEMLQVEEPDVRLLAVRAVGTRTPAAYPLLFELLHHDEAPLRAAAAEAISRSVRLAQWQDGTTAAERHHVPVLDECGRIVAGHVGELARGLRDPSVEVRSFSALTIHKLGDHAAAAEPALARATRDDDPGVRLLASAALARLRRGRWPSVGHLGDLASGGDVDGAPEFGELLLQLTTAPKWSGVRRDGPATEDGRFRAAVLLAAHHMPALESGSPQLYAAALDAMHLAAEDHVSAVIRPHAKDYELCRELGALAMPGLRYDFHRIRMPVGWSSFQDLDVVLRPLGTAALPIYIEGLEHGREEAIWISGSRFADVGEEGIAAAVFLISAWRWGGHRPTGTEFLWDLEEPIGLIGWEPPHPPRRAMPAMGVAAIPLLIDALDDPFPHVRKRACNALGDMGEVGRPAVGSLSALVEDPDHLVRNAAHRALDILEAR